MAWDLDMMVIDEEDGTIKEMVVRNSNLNDELARIQYLFSDKTGTLTSNKMEFSQMSINGRSYEKANQGEIGDQMKKNPKDAPAIYQMLLNVFISSFGF